MSELIECPHCFTSVFLDKEGKCPCCSKSKKDIPLLTKSEFVYKTEKENLLLVASHTLKHSILKVIGGFFFVIIPLPIILLSANTYKLLFYSLFVAIPLLVTGFIDLFDYFKMKNKIKEEYQK